MKAILVFFDSLSRKYLPPYGNDWVHAPNFSRLAQRTTTFDRCYVGSMPCIPARRELHTGRPNFLHRSWGPLEPFDDSMPQLLTKSGVYTHLATDHQHYWEDGGATYHNRYSSYDFIRGQEGDRWKPEVNKRQRPTSTHGVWTHQDQVNRANMPTAEDMPATVTFDRGLEFLDRNHQADNWFLQIECFSPHPPFAAAKRFRDLYDNVDVPADIDFDWPEYGPRKDADSDEKIRLLRRNYAAVVSHCDESLGRVIDFMDAHSMWDDTLLIVTTDHGFLLGEHDSFAFVNSPFYDPVAVKPLFIHDPRCPKPGERRDALVQTVDLPATLLEYFNVDLPTDMLGQPLLPVVKSNAPVRKSAIFGVFGREVNCTDGRYVYMHWPHAEDNAPLYEHTLMPMHMREMFSAEELSQATLSPPLPFSKNTPLLRIPGKPMLNKPPQPIGKRLLWDVESDPEQKHPLHDPAIEQHMRSEMIRLMNEADAPEEQFERLGLAGCAGKSSQPTSGLKPIGQCNPSV